MTPDEFEVVRARLRSRISERRLEAARLALVEGLTLQIVADKFKWRSRQSVYDCCVVARAELADYHKMVAMLTR